MAEKTELSKKEGDVAVLAKQKSALLYQFYETIKNGGEILSAEDLDIAIESLKLAQLDIKDREERKRKEREAEILKEKMEEAEKRRRLAEVRAAKRAEKKRIERVKEITAMDLPIDYINRFDDDAKANVHCDSIVEVLDLLSALGAKTGIQVTEDTDYLIYGAVPGSRKVALAIQFGVNMISEDGFAEMLAMVE